MELIIKQLQFKYNYEYHIYESNKIIYTAKINRNIIPSLRRIVLFDSNNKEIYNLKQESYFKFILKFIPVINFFSFSICPYILYRDHTKIGYLKEKYNGYGHVLGEISGNIYEIWEHTGQYISLYCNEKQVGLIKRNNYKEGDGDEYKLLFNTSLGKDLVVCLCLLSDLLWHTSDKQINSVKLEYATELKGKELNVSWIPED